MRYTKKNKEKLDYHNILILSFFECLKKVYAKNSIAIIVAFTLSIESERSRKLSVSGILRIKEIGKGRKTSCNTTIEIYYA